MLLRRWVAIGGVLVVLAGCGQKAGVHVDPYAAARQGEAEQITQDASEGAGSEPGVDGATSTTSLGGGSSAAAAAGPTTTRASTGAAATRFGKLTLAASKISGTQKTSGDDEDPESYTLTMTITKRAGERFRVESVNDDGDTEDAMTMAVSERGLEMVSTDFEDEDDCVWNKPVVLVPAGASAAGTSSCTVTIAGEEGDPDESYTLAIDWSVKRLDDAGRKTREGDRRVARVETTLKFGSAEEGAATVAEQKSYDLATGQLVDGVQTTVATYGGERISSRVEFHAA